MIADRTRAPINTGMNHNRPWPSRARSSPLIVSLVPAQLTCTQGRKKQTRTMIAVLVLIRRRVFTYLTGPFAYIHTPKRSVLSHYQPSSNDPEDVQSESSN